MKIRFHVPFHTLWGQTIRVCGSTDWLGNWNDLLAPSLIHQGGDHWLLEVDVPEPVSAFEYKYLIVNENVGSRQWEGGYNRQFEPLQGSFPVVDIHDYWRSPQDEELALFSSAFTRVLMSRPVSEAPKIKPSKTRGKTVRFQLLAPRIDQDHVMCLIGSDAGLGSWNEDKPILMSDHRFPVWTAEVLIRKPEEAVEYKFAIWNKREKTIETWEEGPNRRFSVSPELTHGQIISDLHFRYPLGNWKGAGVAMPVFSLRTQQSGGVGEFRDIRTLTDWAVEAGFKLVQILPINDTVASHTWVDSYPYAAISVFGLHPMYMHLPGVGKLRARKAQAEVDAELERLNKLPEVDYEAVMAIKSKFFKLKFDEVKDQFLADPDFKAFFEENKHWLVPYAAFSALRDRYKTPDFSQWPEHSVFNQEAVTAFCAPTAAHFDDVAVHYFIQYHLDKQLLDAVDYARGKGVVLKGDIPIGIFRHSVDAWVAPHLYNMNSQAGAPPDAFSTTGQNWGFPTYNWHEMARDGFAWWRARLTQMARYFDAYRIDHILGFFRIWEIPIDAVQGLLGYFNPAIPYSKAEIGQWGIGFDYGRFCKPYIRGHFIDERLGRFAESAKQTFLNEVAPGFFEFKPEVNTQRKIEAYFAANGLTDSDSQELKEILYSLVAEVIFIEAPFSNGEAFNPRIAMQHTRSFQDLDDYTKSRLNELYNDYFYHRQENFWRNQAMEKLPAIVRATDMLVCGEDLGMVPDCVPGVMAELGLLGLNVQRMPKDPKKEFFHPADAPYLSVVTTSSHDTSTLRGWWEEDRALTQRFYNNLLGHGGSAPFFCEPWLAREIVAQHLYSPGMWAIFPLQDLLAMDAALRREDPNAERINVPANPKHYWRYRLHHNLEDLIKARSFNQMLWQMTYDSGRNASY